jgi:hypothetical protein
MDLLTCVVWPHRLESFHDESVPASKWRGYDSQGNLCYYRHWFSLWDEVTDDDEPYRRLLLAESLEAWRRRDGAWIRQIQRTEGAGVCRGGERDSGFEVVPAQAIPRL